MFLEDFQAKAKAESENKEKAEEDEKKEEDKEKEQDKNKEQEKDVVANGDDKPTAGGDGDGEKQEQPVIKIGRLLLMMVAGLALDIKGVFWTP